VDYCTELRELDLSHCLISEDAMDYLANNLSPNTFKLCFRGIKRIQDHQVKILVSRCNKITEFNLCSTEVNNDSVTYIIKHLHSTLEKLDLTHTNTTLNKLFDLKAMKKLTCLNWENFMVELKLWRNIFLIQILIRKLIRILVNYQLVQKLSLQTVGKKSYWHLEIMNWRVIHLNMKLDLRYWSFLSGRIN